MENTLKLIYETTVKKQTEEPQKEKRVENGEEIEITRTIKKVKPVKLAILKADRKLFKAAEMFYAKSLSHYLKEGLMPYSLVAKRYANDGGPMTDEERVRLKELNEEARKLEFEFYALGKEPDKSKEKHELLLKINNLKMEAGGIQNAYADIFDSTAEIKARNDVIEWWVLHLLLVDLDGKGYKCIFGDGTYEERIQTLEMFENQEEPFTMECIKKLSYLISFWFTAKNSVTKVDFDTVEKLYSEGLSDYKVEESEDLKITTDKPEAPESETTPPTPVT